MNFHPILFTGEMIRANLEGRKTQTRRVVIWPDREDVIEPCDDNFLHHLEDGLWPYQRRLQPDGCVNEVPLRCPYGEPGDVLWARETWARGPGGSRECVYLATVKDGEHPPAWKPSIHMPKWACRLWCRVESVRVQRVQEITLADCAAEGAPPTHEADQVWDSKDTYRKLWNRINEGRGFGWKSNPWVWAITYTVLKEAPEGWAEYCQK